MARETMGRFILIVLDGLGVGEMPDVARLRPQDQGAHTLRNIRQQQPQSRWPNLKAAGVLSYFIPQELSNAGHQNLGSHRIALGKAALAHFGADSYMGHQELAGTKPKRPARQFVREEKDRIMTALRKHGYSCSFDQFITVEQHIAIADNIETDYGLNINVVGSLDHHPYATIESIGRLVRSVVTVGRVITMGGTHVTDENLRKAFEIKTRDGYTAWGINIPRLRIYNEHYQVIHMGYGVNPERQVTQILTRHNIPLVLIGKAADVIVAEGARYRPQVLTKRVLEIALDELRRLSHGLIFANVQETDLAGHEQDASRYAKVLDLVDSHIPVILSQLQPNDIFIITGDHGNDPSIGHTNHTREFTPLIVYGEKINAVDIGIRKSLADVGATVAEYFAVPMPESGTSFLPLIRQTAQEKTEA